MNLKLLASNLALVMVFIFGSLYLATILDQDPRQGRSTIYVDLPTAAGLQERANVSIRGVDVGRVDAISVAKGGVRVKVILDPGVRVPQRSEVRIGSLSLAGEQYLDLRPRSPGGPHIGAGAVLDASDSEPPVTIAALFTNLMTLADQVDPDDIRTIVDESSIALGEGADDEIARTIANSRHVLDALEAAWPETASLLDDSAGALDISEETTRDAQPILEDAEKLGDALTTADEDIQSLLENGPGSIEAVSDAGQDLSDSVTATLPNTVTVATMLRDRTPALALLFPELRAASRAATGFLHDGALHVLVDLTNLESGCLTGLPFASPTTGGNPSPYLYGYCKLTSSDQQTRGAARAPRPAGDTTDVAPKGVRGDERADSVR